MLLLCQDGFADEAIAFAEQYADFFQERKDIATRLDGICKRCYRICQSNSSRPPNNTLKKVGKSILWTLGNSGLTDYIRPYVLFSFLCF